MARTFGKWTTVTQLGSGGSGRVWLARDESGAEGALKVLHSAQARRYLRFRDEVAAMNLLRGRPGILPLIDSYLPVEFSNSNPPWLVTPVANPVRKRLGREAPLESVVAAIARFSETLAGLHKDGVIHRDIKPGNLYWLKGQWALGDFGLVDFPGKEALTRSGEKLGPLYFMAPEMIEDPDAASDHRPADVYSIAKTLYVLATGQNYPIPGHHRRDDATTTLARYVNHARVHFIDSLLERATRNSPEQRPTMEEFAQELSLWVNPQTVSIQTASLSSFKSVIDSYVEPNILRDETRQRILSQAADLQTFANELVGSVVRQLSEVNRATRLLADNSVALRAGIRPRMDRCIAAGGASANCNNCGIPPIVLSSGIAFEIFPDEVVFVVASHQTASHGKWETAWTKQGTGALGSLALMETFEKLTSELVQNSSAGILAFIKRLEGN
jgi:serine/threonine protein kinase